MSVVLFWSRVAVLGIETAFWNKWLTRFARQRWAASFFDSSNLAQRLLRSQRPSIFMTLPTHIPFFAVSVVLIIAGSVSRQNWMATFGACLFMEPFVRSIKDFRFVPGHQRASARVTSTLHGLQHTLSTASSIWSSTQRTPPAPQAHRA